MNCKDCNEEFIFTVGEQEFYEQKGFTNTPMRCNACQKAKKDRFNDGGRSGGGGYGGSSGGRSNECYAFQKGIAYDIYHFTILIILTITVKDNVIVVHHADFLMKVVVAVVVTEEEVMHQLYILKLLF